MWLTLPQRELKTLREAPSLQVYRLIYQICSFLARR